MIFFWCAGILFALFLFFFALGYYCFSVANRRKKHYPSEHRAHGGDGLAPEHGEAIFREACLWFDRQPFEKVSVVSCDGLRLCGQLLPATQPAKGIVIGFHGYHSSAKRDLAVHAQMLSQAGYHLLLATQRAHGESEGTYICFGAKERLDVAPWCRLASERFGSDLPIALLGLSMGASTVLLSADTALPPQVKAMVADCGFTEPWEIIARTLRRKHKIFPYPVIFFMNAWSRHLAGFDYWECSTVESLKNNSLPIFLIHGTADLYVHCKMSERIARAYPEQIDYFPVSGARHVQSVLFEPEEYRRRMLSFLQNNLS